MPTVFTIGHSTRSVAELLGILQDAQVDLVIDIRSIPRSRAVPQFNGDAFARDLAAAGIGYLHLDELGGRRGRQHLGGSSPNALWRNASFRNYADYALTNGFRQGLERLIGLARRHRPALMCAEAVWWRCHRRIVADYLLEAGIPVTHLMGPGQSQAATLTPGATPQGDGTIHYIAAPDRDDPTSP